MAELRTATTDDTLITERLLTAIPAYESIKIENRLLDGSYHIQTIGIGGRILNCSLITEVEGKDLIDIYESTGAPVKAISGGKYYIGTIRNTPVWNYIGVGRYRTNLTLLVSEEGDVT